MTRKKRRKKEPRTETPLDHKRVWERIEAEIESLNDQFAAIVATSYIDRMLEQICVETAVDKTLAKTIYGLRNSGFVTRVNFLAVTGRISTDEEARLKALAEIRNLFAHDPYEYSFESLEIRGAIEKFVFGDEMLPPHRFPYDLDDPEIATFEVEVPERGDYRGRFIASLRAMNACLMSRMFEANRESTRERPEPFKTTVDCFRPFVAFGEKALDDLRRMGLDDQAEMAERSLHMARVVVAHAEASEQNRKKHRNNAR